MKNFPIIAFLLLTLSIGAFAQRSEPKQVDAKLEAVKVNAGTFVNYSFEGDICTDMRGNSIAITYYRQVGSITDSGDTILWAPEPITVRLPISENQQQFQLFASPGIIQAVSGFLKTQIDTTDFGQFKIKRK